MRHPFASLLLLLALAPAFANAAPEAESCAAFGEARTRADLLRGRLTIEVPASAAAVPNQPRNLMGPSDGDESRTEVAVAQDGAKLRVVAAELFARRGSLGDAELRDAIARFIAMSPGELVPLDVAPPAPLRMVALAPKDPRAVDDATTVFASIVEDGDGYLAFVGMSLDGDGVSATECAPLIRAIAASVSAGTRRLDAAAGWRRIGDVPGVGPVEIELPAGWTVRKQAGPDFDVWYVTEVTQLDAPSPSIGIYSGGHPSFRPQGTASSTGHVLGKRVAWFDGTAAGPETNGLVELGEHDVLHIWMNADSPDELARLRRVVESLRKVPAS